MIFYLHHYIFLRKKKIKEKHVNHNRWDITKLVNYEIQNNDIIFRH